MYIPYKRARIPFSRQGRRVFQQKMATGSNCVIEFLILKLKPQAEVTAALMGKKFKITKINHPLVAVAFEHTMHVGFVDTRSPKMMEDQQDMWQEAVRRCEELNGSELPEWIKKPSIKDEDGETFSL